MNEASLKRLMKLARKTGDVLIVTDPDGLEPIVLMNIDRYETLREDEIDRQEDEDWEPSEPIMDWAQGMDILDGTVGVGPSAYPMEEDPEIEFEERIGPTVAEPVVTPIAQAEEESTVEVDPSIGPIAEKPQKSAENGEEKFYLESID